MPARATSGRILPGILLHSDSFSGTSEISPPHPLTQERRGDAWEPKGSPDRGRRIEPGSARPCLVAIGRSPARMARTWPIGSHPGLCMADGRAEHRQSPAAQHRRGTGIGRKSGKAAGAGESWRGEACRNDAARDRAPKESGSGMNERPSGHLMQIERATGAQGRSDCG